MPAEHGLSRAAGPARSIRLAIVHAVPAVQGGDSVLKQRCAHSGTETSVSENHELLHISPTTFSMHWSN